MGPRRTTLADVAAHAGVSRATASLVLRGAGQLADGTRDRVRSSMDTLGYVYHRGAASLRARQTKTVGLVVPDPSNAFMAELTIGLESVLADNGLLTLTANTFEDPARQDVLVRALLERQVDGMVVLPVSSSGEPLVDQLERAGIPAVICIRAIEDDRASYVGIDNVLGGQLAADHLLQHGCRIFAYLGGLAGLRPRRERLRGVRQAIASNPDARLLTHRSGPSNGQWGREAAARLFVESTVPDAVVCHNDAVAFGVYRALRDVAPDAVDRIHVVGFDDVDEAALWEPPISSVSENGREVGSQAARVLLRRIADPSTRDETVLLTPHLVVRRSCGCPDRDARAT